MVQGLGFRPLVYRLATAAGLSGTVANTGSGLQVRVNCDREQAGELLQQICDNAPSGSILTKISFEEVEEEEFDGFSILDSDTDTISGLLITPDIALCADCRIEFRNPHDRRFGYAFITCTTCGPRYSIQNGLPYDRIRTSMHAYTPCPVCQQEYEQPDDRRYYSQTNSCLRCGIKLQLVDANGRNLVLPGTTISGRVSQALLQGAIVAVKGIGGFLLVCDARQRETVLRLRSRKHRPGKPLAVLFKSIQEAEQYVQLNTNEREMLRGGISPIVVAMVKETGRQLLPMDALAPGLSTLGVMLPYAPLLEWLMQCVSFPLVATSANLSHSPILYREETAIQSLRQIADLFLFHDRTIQSPQDDSVLRFSSRNRQIIWLRRGRGLAPSMPHYHLRETTPVLAFGAMLKSSFTISAFPFVYTSQYLGDTGNYDAQQAYKESLQHLSSLLNTAPAIVLADRHPQYPTREMALQYLQNQPTARGYFIQHHKAHAAAILGEHGLHNSVAPVLTVCWDGTGWGDDSNVWGSEFFIYQNKTLQRVAHLEYAPHLLGDKMAREPRLSVLLWCHDLPEADEVLRPLFSNTEWPLYKKMLKRPSLSTSSMGRLFDAVAALLGLTEQHYEGQAAMQLEAMATEADANLQSSSNQQYKVVFGDGEIRVSEMIGQLLLDIKAGISSPVIAWKFHFWLVNVVKSVAMQYGVQTLAFSGGVFQNALLADMLIDEMGERNKLFFHTRISANDENISFGQLVYWDQNIDGIQQWPAHTGYPENTAVVINSGSTVIN